MSYLFFDANRKDFDDGEGNSVSLGQHLSYVGNWGGSPDCCDSTDTDNRSTAILEALETGDHLYIVERGSFRVVGHVNQPT